MSIRIDKITTGRFGNKILQYNSLVQISNNNNVKASCCEWEGNKYFKNIVPPIKSKSKKKGLFCKSLLDNEKLDFKNFDYCLDDPAYCLHNVFYKITNKDPRCFLELKDEFKPKLKENILHIGLHFRGGDKNRVDNGREIHKFGYYKDSIDFVINNLIDKEYIFILCTDDIKFVSFKNTINYLKEKKYKFMLGPATQNVNKHYIYDFAILSYCDILINNSSTFCVTAGFLGKKDKYIIHSKNWIEKNKKHEPWNSKGENIMKMLDNHIKTKEFWIDYDNFWIEVSKCNTNNYYYCNTLI
uniref:Glycosyltransferase n=1 Tax=Florenciella sp. virus SA2 TaxID=3240092 RepID=A0AB39J935_9VIRU